jgi:hypothetical protein
MTTGTERNGSNDSQEIPAVVLRGAGIIRDQVAVRWPAGHVEIALIQLQRRRQQRRYKAAGAALSMTGVALAVALGFGGRIHDELTARGVLARPGAPERAAASAPKVAPAREVAAASATAPAQVVIPSPTPIRAEAQPATPAREGHLLQQRLVPRRQVAAARWVTLAGERRFGEAYGLLKQVPLRDLSDPDDLMLAAGLARR